MRIQYGGNDDPLPWLPDMATARVNVQLTITNMRAIKALRAVCRALDEVADDMPWRQDVKKARRAMRYAIKNLELKQAKGRQ